MKQHIDILNTVLIIVSLALAYIFPFELFLIVYAILGPLHYLTEINWIRDKSYFVKNKNWAYLALGCALIIALPAIFKLSWFESSTNAVLSFLREELPKITNGFIFMALVMAYVFLFIPNKKVRYIVIGISIVLAIVAKNLSVYNIWIGIFLPTIIHVYVFTLLFMWYGNLKTHHKIGYLNVALLAAVPIIISIIGVSSGDYEFSNTVKETIVGNRFHVLNANISKLLGLTDGTTFFFYEVIDLKIQMMIAFAYTYHYLNWFSKTTVIGWHKKLTTKKSLVIVILWIISVLLYVYDYKTGLALLLMLSLIHVFLEFPLNILSVKSIYNYYFKSSS
ncbi:MAG: hypothetical protein AAF901_05275 [Bacteroidota bacterium]